MDGVANTISLCHSAIVQHCDRLSVQVLFSSLAQLVVLDVLTRLCSETANRVIII